MSLYRLYLSFIIIIYRLEVYFNLLPAALAEAGLEITFKVGHKPIVGGGGRDICPPPPPNLAGEVVTFVHLPRQIWRGR